ncbi:uncharacterized protein LOC109708694 [Ananas comosus]|uniref:Uncharacterized protein LOC109708694 n=1 Tax=Ananas comosus TaxID=4615 RepID=A0A6P5ERF8_ANACO|nr:uncharacterized protein LOC109708694 [Ananas comosus]
MVLLSSHRREAIYRPPRSTRQCPPNKLCLEKGLGPTRKQKRTSSPTKVLEEARRHVRRGEARGSALDSLHLKLKKPISKEKKQKQQQQQQRHRRSHWWRSAGSALLLLWKRPKSNTADLEAAAAEAGGYDRPRYPHQGAVSGPLYVADGSSAAAGEVGCRAIRPTSGPLAAAEVGAAGAGIPYLSLRDLNLLDRRPAAAAAPAPPPMPIYLVT